MTSFMRSRNLNIAQGRSETEDSKWKEVLDEGKTGCNFLLETRDVEFSTWLEIGW